MKRLSCALFLLAGALNGPALALDPDTTLPTVEIELPAAGVKQLTNEIVVSGTAADTANAATIVTGGVAKVEYRLKGSSKWHRATLTNAGEASTDWVFTIKLSKGKSTWVTIRSVDRSGNESDRVSREIRRERVTRKFQSG